MTAGWWRRGRSRGPVLLFTPPSTRSGRRTRLRGVALMTGRVVAAIAVLSGTLLGVSLAVEPARADLLCKADVASDPTNLGPETLDAGTTAWVPFVPREDVRPTGPKAENDKDPTWKGTASAERPHAVGSGWTARAEVVVLASSSEERARWRQVQCR